MEVFGFDFMVDDQFNTWIIEINKSPSIETNTVSLLRSAYYERTNSQNGRRYRESGGGLRNV